MSEIDQIKEEIGWLKVVFALLVAAAFSLMAWFVQKSATADNGIIMLAIFGMLVDVIGIYLVNRAAYRRMQQLRNL